jgi:putative ABC transport system substrate-binding protein
MSGKWVELLNELVPELKRVAMMFNPDTAPGGGSYFVSRFSRKQPSPPAPEPVLQTAARHDDRVEASGIDAQYRRRYFFV